MRATILSALTVLVGAAAAFGHGGIPESLAGVPVPAVPGLLTGAAPIVRHRERAIALGKALFWDIQVGSDGMACASCHYHAGTDARVKNQLAPGRSSSARPTAATFEPMPGGRGGPNYTLGLADFPLHRLADPADFASLVLFTTDDVVGSAGSFGGEFRAAADRTSAFDDCVRAPDATFNVHGVGTRRVTSRNAPSVINAAFNRRNFWDGRANHVFNGVNALGDRDPEARIWVWRRGALRSRRLSLANAALASQAVGPPLDTTEMSCAGRTFADIGRKLLHRRPLRFQAVHAADSVLAPYRHRSGSGLRPTYAALIRRAFDRRYWAAPARVRARFGTPAAGGPPYGQMEANFALFFGVAVQLYESTLISGQAPFDAERDADGVPKGLTEEQRRGLAAFVDLHCNECHGGPTLSGGVLLPAGSAVTEVDRKPIRLSSGAMVLGLVDTGFVNTGVGPSEDDPGLGGADSLGHALSLTAQYLELLQGRPQNVLDPLTVQTCAMTAPFALAAFGQPAFAPGELAADPGGTAGCGAPRWAAVPAPAVVARELAEAGHGRLPSGTSGAFKVPSLRNVEITGPYMHNGSMATLEEVLEFYNRGGNFSSLGKDAQFLFGVGVSDAIMADVIAFLRALTDERVRWERAPFDHPALPLPHGHAGDERAVDEEAPGLARTEVVEIPAVGAEGRGAALGPLPSFAGRLALGCATKEPAPPPPPAVAVQESPTSAAALVTATATVEAVDMKTRMVTLINSEGERFQIRAGDEVRNLAQVRKGDQVTTTYYESVALKLSPAGSAKPGVSVTEEMERAEPGQKPGGLIVRNVTLTAKITKIDRKKQTVTLEGPEGKSVTLKAADPKNLEVAQVGQMVTATYREALAISVAKPGK